MWRPRSSIPGIAWPALPLPRRAQVLSILYQLQQTQWWPADALFAMQRRQLNALLRHAFATVPFYRDRLRDLSRADTPDAFDAAWRVVPVLSRGDIQDNGPALLSTAPPKQHGTLGWIETSGTSGKPVRVRDSVLNQQMWGAASLRGYEWRQWDLSARFACIRADKANASPYPAGRTRQDWGPMLGKSFVTGPGYFLDIHTDPAKQAEWLARVRPQYLMTYASNALHVARHCLADGPEITGLDSIEFVSETVTDEIRQACRDAWDARVYANYSSREAGCIALECPDTGAYHVQSELVLVEILDDAGNACRAGETGRVVLTPLHNFAMPLIRYDIGDYAEVGPPCRCGRGLPVLSKVLGRQNALIRLPTGERFWSPFHGEVFTAVAPVRQYQIVQHALDEMEVRLVVDRRLDAEQEARLSERLQADLRYPFRIRYTYVDAIPRTPGGKYQVFISHVDAP